MNEEEEKMKTTYFRPSIHGWPFGNNWRKSFDFGPLEVTLDMGFCGGMCWRALHRFYNAIPILRDTPAPSEGDVLYNEIWDEQVNSVPASTLLKIWAWHNSPDLDHFWNPRDSLGKRTQSAWPGVKESIDASKPVTITLISRSNNLLNPKSLENDHRVVAYAYDIDSTVGAGAPAGANSKVTLWIYDPNYPDGPNYAHDADDVKLTFYLGAERSNIRLRHSEGDEYHGFFKDDMERDYIYPDATFVRIDKCEQTGISSATRADYDLKFSWQCPFIPYFNILVDDESWKYNNQAKSQYEPAHKDNKQCSSRTGSVTASLRLPRDISTVAVRLLDDDAYYESIEVDARPVIKCYPYIRSRAIGGPCVCDYSINDTDLYVKDPNPSAAAVQQLDTSEYRWVMKIPRPDRDIYIDMRPDGDDLTTARVETFDRTALGNIIVPILANFEERNLATPTVKSGVVKTIRNGAVVQTTNLDPLADQAQEIFDGFQNNPSDYDNDTTVEFTYQSKDIFQVVAQGRAEFFGKSILYEQSRIIVSSFDPDKLGIYLSIARELVELGIIDVAINLPSVPRTTDPVILINSLREQPQLQGMIDQAFQSSWGNRRIWQQIWNAQSELLKLAEKGKAIHVEGEAKKGRVLKATKDLQEMQQREVDALMLNIMAKRTIDRLRRDTKFMSILMSCN